MVVLHCCFSLVLFSVLSLLTAYKTDTWPPKLFYEHFDVPGIVSKCKNQCNANTEQIKEFEMTPDVDHLPDSDELKCYFLCLYIEAHLMKPNSTAIDPSELIDLAQKLNNEEYKNLLTLSKGCLSRVRKLKKPIEIAYQLNVCGKQNSPELYYTYY